MAEIYDEYDFEAWEPDAELYEKEDWKGLLRLRKEFITRHPNDLHAQERYVEALNFNKNYDEAIQYVTPLYKKYYDQGFGINQIIDALLGLGKTENDYNWIKKPEILKLDKTTLNICISLLKSKRRPISITDLYCDLLINCDYLMFQENDFFEFLKTNKNIFIFIGDTEYYFDTKIKLDRNNLKKTIK